MPVRTSAVFGRYTSGALGLRVGGDTMPRFWAGLGTDGLRAAGIDFPFRQRLTQYIEKRREGAKNHLARQSGPQFATIIIEIVVLLPDISCISFQLHHPPRKPVRTKS